MGPGSDARNQPGLTWVARYRSKCLNTPRRQEDNATPLGAGPVSFRLSGRPLDSRYDTLQASVRERSVADLEGTAAGEEDTPCHRQGGHPYEVVSLGSFEGRHELPDLGACQSAPLLALPNIGDSLGGADQQPAHAPREGQSGLELLKSTVGSRGLVPSGLHPPLEVKGSQIAKTAISELRQQVHSPEPLVLVPSRRFDVEAIEMEASYFCQSAADAEVLPDRG